MLRPTRFVRQGASPGGTGGFMGSGTPQGKNNMILGVAALVGITGLVYWMGYSDVDKRHRNDVPVKKG